MPSRRFSMLVGVFFFIFFFYSSLSFPPCLPVLSFLLASFFPIFVFFSPSFSTAVKQSRMENGTRLRASVMRALESHLVRCICCLASASFIFFVVLYQNCAVQGSESHLVFTFGLDVTERFESLSQSLLSSHESHGSLLLSRRKREENKKHIEQSVKERQKVCVSLGLICLSKG